MSAKSTRRTVYTTPVNLTFSEIIALQEALDVALGVYESKTDSFTINRRRELRHTQEILKLQLKLGDISREINNLRGGIPA